MEDINLKAFQILNHDSSLLLAKVLYANGIDTEVKFIDWIVEQNIEGSIDAKYPSAFKNKVRNYIRDFEIKFSNPDNVPNVTTSFNTFFIEKHGIERSFPAKRAKEFEKVLKKANESYVLLWKKEKHTKINGVQYYNYYVHCPTTRFAEAYAHLGFLWCTQISKYYIK